MNKSLIIYFSRADENYSVGYIEKGNTEVLAEYVKEYTNADIFKVEPLIPYSKEYSKCIEEAKERVGNAPIKETLNSISNYDTIYIMTPIYWGTLAPELETQLKQLDFAGKRIRIITTHEGSGLGSVVNDIKKICSGANIQENAIAIYGSKVKESKEISKERYYAEALFSMYDWKKIGIEEFSKEDRELVIQKIEEAGYKERIPEMTRTEFMSFLGINKVEGTSLEKVWYQEQAVNKTKEQIWGTGRRKKSIARVYLVPGTGKITINKRDIDEYFGLETLKVIVRQPLVATDTLSKYDVIVKDGHIDVRGFKGDYEAIIENDTDKTIKFSIS